MSNVAFITSARNKNQSKSHSEEVLIVRARVTWKVYKSNHAQETSIRISE